MNEIIIEDQLVFSKILNNIVKTNNNVQAYLLMGNSNKKLKEYSLLLSKILICPYKYSMNCNKCSICKRIDNNNFGEINLINPTSEIIKKEEIIKLRNSFQTSSIEGKNQVYIINQAEKLNLAAANSMLKFLEEPAGNTVAIFNTTNLDKMINTITSRCQIIKLNDMLDKNDLLNELINLKEDEIDIVMKLFFDIENNHSKSLITGNTQFIQKFNDRLLLKSAMLCLLLLYKDTLNYKLFNKMKYFKNETGIKNISKKIKTSVLTNKISFILENLSKLEYNVNILLFINNFLIRIGEI